jgi:hypothetical protein
LAPAESFGSAAKIVGAVVGGVALAILASVAAHSVITAFEGRLAPWPDQARARTGAKAGGSA